MARRYRSQNTSTDQIHLFTRVPWRLFLLLFLLLVIAVPAYLYGSRLGGNIMPNTTQFVSGLLNPRPSPIPTPVPTFPSVLPQVGSLLYTVQEGDSCVGFLASQMHMYDAGEVFSDLKPETVKALNAALGQDCHSIQPGMVLPLSPQYPLDAIGGEVVKIEATTPQQVVPTPLINVPNSDLAADCSGGCLFIVRISPTTQVRLSVQTALSVHIGSWIWAQATLARKAVSGFDAYPYADLHATLNGMPLQACDFQVGTVHDDNSFACDQLAPNTIDADGGAWLFSVSGPLALDHWHYNLHASPGTRLLVWLTQQNGRLVFQRGNPVYRYDEAKHLYVNFS